MGIGITFAKVICFFSGPHCGVSSDTTIGRRTIETLPRPAWEWWIGDRVYMYVRQVLAGYRRQHVPGTSRPRLYYQLTPVQEQTNAVIGHYRSRVEQLISVLKNHAAMGKGGVAFRGDLLLLEAIIKVTIHTTAVLVRLDPNRRSPGFGNWAH